MDMLKMRNYLIGHILNNKCGRLGGKSEMVLTLTLFYLFRENNVKSGGWLIMHHVVTLTAERHGVHAPISLCPDCSSFMCLRSKA
ncbi:hypothetical protein Hanom_Chr12g01162341 [Helianthus anomalus]